MSAEINIALVGAGQMGSSHARVIAEQPRTRLGCVIDVDLDRAMALAQGVGAEFSSELEAAAGCDAVVIAVPTEHHVLVAKSLLSLNLPLLIEKPLASELPDVKAVVEEAAARRVPVMCGFVERFNPVISTAVSLLDEAPIHIVAVRHSPNTPRIKTSVVYDLLIHDIDLAFMFASESGLAKLVASRWSPPGSGVDEIADCTLTFGTGMLATLSSSRVSQRKIRSLTVATERQLFELDLLRQDVSVYRHVRHGAAVGPATGYRAETVVDIPFVRHAGEPLALQLSYFLDLVKGLVDPDAERERILPPHEVAARVHRK